jgi:hypothetical protein
MAGSRAWTERVGTGRGSWTTPAATARAGNDDQAQRHSTDRRAHAGPMSSMVKRPRSDPAVRRSVHR